MSRKPFETFAHYKIGKGFATLAVSVDDGNVRVGVSYCHPRDNINKSFGRDVAVARREIGSDFSFEFTRDGRRLGEQLRAEFEAFVTESGRALTLLRAMNHDNTRVGAPPWAIHSLNREIRKRMRDNVIDCDAFDMTLQSVPTHTPLCC